MSWSLKFDEPIALAKGKPLRTLREATEHVIALMPHEGAHSYPYKQSHLVALRTTKISAVNPASHWSPGER